MNPVLIDILIQALNLKPEPIKTFLSQFIGQNTNSIVLTMGRPQSTGEILLRTKNPLDKPIIDPKYLSHKDDIHALVEGK